MDSRAKLFGHPVHQMLIVLPLGLFTASVVFDLIFLFGGDPTMAVVAYWMIVTGIAGGLLAAPFGLIDWLAIPEGTRAKKIGLYHGAGNLVVVLLFIGSWLIRVGEASDPAGWAFVLSFAGMGLALFTGWLGGELVDRLGIGVYDNAHTNAPSSLAEGRPVGGAFRKSH
jgi:uncharacterized membrane protein